MVNVLKSWTPASSKPLVVEGVDDIGDHCVISLGNAVGGYLELLPAFSRLRRRHGAAGGE